MKRIGESTGEKGVKIRQILGEVKNSLCEIALPVVLSQIIPVSLVAGLYFFWIQ